MEPQISHALIVQDLLDGYTEQFGDCCIATYATGIAYPQAKIRGIQQEPTGNRYVPCWGCAK